MKEGFSLKNLFPSYDVKDLEEYNYIGEEIILSIFNIFICLAGLVGNGRVIWLLGFRVKRKPFATYILNLAVADFGCLVLGLVYGILNILMYVNRIPDFILYEILIILWIHLYNCSQLLLTAIGIDRCVSVLFPNWYQCHRSPGLSTRVCVLMWALSFVLQGVPMIISFTHLGFISLFHLFSVYFVISLICVLLVTISDLTLLIKVCFKSQPCHCGNLWKVVLFMLPSFLFLTILSNTSAWVILFPIFGLSYLMLGISLKSSINPLIYFLAGRQEGNTFQKRMVAILQRVFKEERDTRTELQPRMETQL